MKWSHLVHELSSKTCYRRKCRGNDRSERKTRKQT